MGPRSAPSSASVCRAATARIPTIHDLQFALGTAAKPCTSQARSFAALGMRRCCRLPLHITASSVVLQRPPYPFPQVHLGLPVEYPTCPGGVELGITVEEIHAPSVNRRVYLECGTYVFHPGRQSPPRG